MQKENLLLELYEIKAQKVLENLRNCLDLEHTQGVSIVALSKIKIGNECLNSIAIIKQKAGGVHIEFVKKEYIKVWAKKLGLFGYIVTPVSMTDNDLIELSVSINPSMQEKAKKRAISRLEPSLKALRALRRSLKIEFSDMDWSEGSYLSKALARKVATYEQHAKNILKNALPLPKKIFKKR